MYCSGTVGDTHLSPVLGRRFLISLSIDECRFVPVSSPRCLFTGNFRNVISRNPRPAALITECDSLQSFQEPVHRRRRPLAMKEVMNAWLRAFLEVLKEGTAGLQQAPTAALLAVLKRLPFVRLRQQAIVVILLVNILRSAKSLANRLRLSVELLSFHWSSEARRVRAHSLSFGDAPRQPPESPRRRRSFSMTSCRLPVIDEQEFETELMNHDT